jgi:Na+-transporting NADH:ubiquinone oxidoreductase subunit NqrC
MFSFISKPMFKIISLLLVIATISGIIYAGYRYVSNLQTQVAQLVAANAILTVNNLQLEQGIKEQADTIKKLQEDIELQATLLAETYDKFNKANAAVSSLEERLSQHELGYLAANRPGLVQNIINNASDNIARCFEIASGSPLTDAERNATLPSQINRECPDLANPNFRGQK